MKRKHKRKAGNDPIPTSHRIYYVGERFTVLRSVVDKWGARRVAVIEHEPGKPPTRIDPRLKCIKHICKIWQWGQNSRKGWAMGTRSMNEARQLGPKLERLWPMHFAAKELKGRVLYVGRSRKPGELKWIVQVIGKLMPRNQRWLVSQGLIQIDPDGHIQLTAAGYTQFVRSYQKDKKHDLAHRTT